MTTKTITEAQLAAALHGARQGCAVACYQLVADPLGIYMPDAVEQSDRIHEAAAAAIFAALPESRATVMKVRTSAGEDYAPGQQAQVSSALPDTGLELTTAVVNPLDVERLAPSDEQPDSGGRALGTTVFDES